MSNELPRRRFLTGLGVSAGAGALAMGTADAATLAKDGPTNDKGEPIDPDLLADSTIDFDGEHQAGISNPQQAQAWVMAFDIKDGGDRQTMRRLMRTWTEDARRMSLGVPSITELEPEMVQRPANLTFTIGFGQRFFDVIDRVAQRPEWLHPLPKYDRDNLQDKWSGGDIMLQVCCDDPMTLSHVTRYMIRNGAPYVDLRWAQVGFLNANGSRPEGATPRNRFGQLDGTINPRTDEEYDDIVWINEGPEWLRGGTSMVVRRVEMFLREWELLDRNTREEVVGRKLASGAPLGQKKEHDPVDLDKRDQFGLPFIDPKSHVARSMPKHGKPSLQIRRRVFQYDLPPTADLDADSDTGLIFIAFQKDPMKQFDPIQKRLDKVDRLNEWIEHIGSAVFAIPGGTGPNEYWGEKLLKD
ncbi:Dyp-type peroxidase [Corynebacterium sp. TAE3-ERU12]|uniref:Dyp-type peroxidase n=1 Tax=Corynebacterium sp. TAE3-ERU12 TaxID=2849491 RepID=UPI001C438446|nr:Dyp-type peroxidase [Corynebacterium sp. TAE3-ERU12]MBV7295341.1 Dyp-type peroxidase [Corynebacterium sp. TAE3-ERU12]